MVLTDLPFERGKLLHSRYDMIRRPDSAPIEKQAPKTEEENGEESKEYAAFLRRQERKVGPEGFLDSNRFSYTHFLKKDKDGQKAKLMRTKAKSDATPENVVQLTAKIKQDEKEYTKTLKVIEDHMWQHKQEERELKRTEGDIIKNQRSVRHTLRDYGNAINKKRMAEEKKLNQSLERFTKMSRDHVHHKEELNKERVQSNISRSQDQKATQRKDYLKLSDLERQFHSKKAAVELKKAEVYRLSQDFESKMKQKEEEQYRLKQELAELSITLNMESQKARVQNHTLRKNKQSETSKRQNDDLTSQKHIDHKLTKSDGDIKESMMMKRKLDADLSVTKAHLDIKKRDEQRHLTDTQMRLEDNTTTQRQLNDSAFHAGMDLKAKKIDQKVEAHNVRRVNRLTAHMKQKKEKEDGQQEVWEARFKVRDHEAKRKKHEDALKFFQKMVTKGEEQEQQLYTSVRNAEYTRQKQDQSVRRLQQQLAEAKRINAQKLKHDAMERKRQEDELQQAYIREKAELDKAHAEREESYIQLQQHRQKLQEDRHLHAEHEREHQRLLRIGTKSETLTDGF